VARRGATPPAASSGAAPTPTWYEVVERFDDAAAALALRSRQVRAIDRTMYALSRWGDDGRLWIAASAIEAARVRSPRRFAALVAWLGAESALVNLGIKRIARRPRPDVITDHEFWLRIPTDTSFPSGHAASSALMAVLLSNRSPLAPLWVAAAVGVGASRVHVGVHHGSDVAAGWLVGAGLGVLARRMGRHTMFDLGMPGVQVRSVRLPASERPLERG
jgi:undecaprenyl-diphosphatase